MIDQNEWKQLLLTVFKYNFHQANPYVSTLCLKPLFNTYNLNSLFWACAPGLSTMCKFQMVHPLPAVIMGPRNERINHISSSVQALYSSPSTSRLTQMHRSTSYLIYMYSLILLNHVRVIKMLQTMYNTQGIAYDWQYLIDPDIWQPSQIYTPFQWVGKGKYKITQ